MQSTTARTTGAHNHSKMSSLGFVALPRFSACAIHNLRSFITGRSPLGQSSTRRKAHSGAHPSEGSHSNNCPSGTSACTFCKRSSWARRTEATCSSSEASPQCFQPQSLRCTNSMTVRNELKGGIHLNGRRLHHPWCGTYGLLRTSKSDCAHTAGSRREKITRAAGECANCEAQRSLEGLSRKVSKPAARRWFHNLVCDLGSSTADAQSAQSRWRSWKVVPW
mmetsp:Transcript_67807/g.175660  ORF Transcript_67807/g.175660 Transcript_67807/m.175660 type:complete len:222 (+) Transcript_67807:72-737(+)